MSDKPDKDGTETPADPPTDTTDVPELNEETPPEDASDKVESPVEDGPVGDNPLAEDTPPEDVVTDDTAPDDPPAPEEPRQPDEPARRGGGGFLGVILGGALAAALGAGAALYLYPMGLNGERIAGELSTLQDRVDGAEAALAAQETPDLSGVEAGIAGLSQSMDGMQGTLGELSQRLDDLSTQVSALDARLTEVEKRPMDEGVSQAAIDAYERELRALQDSVATQRAEIEAMASSAAEAEANAEETAKSAMARAAMTRVLTALDSGEPYAAALADLEAAQGIDAPAILTDLADDGVPSLPALQDGFIPAARAALSAARGASEGGDTASRLTTFLQNQLGARSVTPREGDDPDAILSRAEAALRANRLTDALAELAALPDTARAPMADWIATAERRQAALAAANDLAQQLSSQ